MTCEVTGDDFGRSRFRQGAFQRFDPNGMLGRGGLLVRLLRQPVEGWHDHRLQLRGRHVTRRVLDFRPLRLEFKECLPIHQPGRRMDLVHERAIPLIGLRCPKRPDLRDEFVAKTARHMGYPVVTVDQRDRLIEHLP